MLGEANYWLTWGPGALLALLGVVGVAYKMLRILFRIDAALPTLLTIAEEFKPNGGNSLKDHMSRIDETMTLHTDKLDELENLVRSESSDIQTKQNTARDVAAQTAAAQTVVNVTAKPA